MLENDLAAALKMLIEHDAGTRAANELRQLALAVLNRSAAQVLALKLNEIEGAEHRGPAVSLSPDKLEHGKTVLVGDDRLAVDQERVGRERRHCRHGERKSIREIVTVAGKQSDTGTIASGHDAEAVVLDLMNPSITRWWSLGR